MAMTREEVLALPVTVDLLTTAKALGIGRSMAYELAQRGEYPLPLYRVGQRYRATRADLLATLGIQDDQLPTIDDPHVDLGSSRAANAASRESAARRAA
jgi:hypothetical protein